MSTAWMSLGQHLHSLLNAHGLAVIALVLFVEELGIPIPIPGDLVMLLGGIRVAHGQDALWAVLLVEEAATVAGASLLFAGSRRFGRSFVTRYGRLVHLGPETLERAEARVRRHGGWAIVVARLVPGFRIITVVAAGVLGLPYRTVLPALACGAFLYLLIYTLLGLFVGPVVLAFMERLALPVSALVSLATLVALGLVLRALRQGIGVTKSPWQASLGTALLAGVVSGGMALLGANAVLGLVSFGVRLLGHTAPPINTSVTEELHLLFDWPLFLLVAAALGIIAAGRHVRRLPSWLHLMVFAGAPLALTLLLLNPFLDESTVDLTSATGAVLAAVALLRWLTFGVALVRLGPLFARVRQSMLSATDDVSAVG